MQHIRSSVIKMSNIISACIKLFLMQTLPYKVIKSKAQYNKYCDVLEALTDTGKKSKAIDDEIELLTLLIEKYDEEHNRFQKTDPVELLKYLMKEHNLKAVDLAKLLQVSEGLVSDMLHYKKGLSKETIRILSERFKLNQDAFNQPYNLKPGANTPRSKIRGKKKKLTMIK
jgi:HTH-type transcriptional regulator / antitoxin HigA